MNGFLLYNLKTNFNLLRKVLKFSEFESCWPVGSSGFEGKKTLVPLVETSAENSAAQGGK
jgi:hypothetical protein